MLKQLLWVALGGGLGTAARYAIQKSILLKWNPGFPWGTFIVNISGCFLIGILWALSLKSNLFSDSMKLFLMTGVCGGYTTFSAFSLENISLLKEGKFSLFLIYSFGSLLLGFLATYSAFRIIRP